MRMLKMRNGKDQFYVLDDKDKAIVKKLVRDPTISDNQIAKITGIPVKTVNRRRKALEDENIVSYYVNVDMGKHGTGRFLARHLYLIEFKLGFPQSRLVKEIMEEPNVRTIFTDHIYESHIAEADGRTALIMVVEGRNDEEVNEAFNSKIIPSLKKNHGEDAITNVRTIRLADPIRVFHNYVFSVNMSRSKIKEEWSDTAIFVE
jgi:DNA-binding Lrp family transcriptional regulator